MSFIHELLEDKHATCHRNIIHVDMDMEPWEVGELLEEFHPLMHEKFPNIKLDIDGYRTYEEEYGGFLAHGILTMDMNDLTRDDISFIKSVIFENI